MSFDFTLSFGSILNRAVKGIYDIAISSKGQDNEENLGFPIHIYFKRSE